MTEHAREIGDKLLDYYQEQNEKRNRRSAQYVNRASSLGYPCLRSLVYDRLAHERRSAYPLGTTCKFMAGEEVERLVLRQLNDAGIDIIKAQQDLSWKKFNLSGHPDGVAVTSQGESVIEIKGLDTHVWASVKNVEDLNDRWWTKKYLYQMSAYMLMMEVPRGVFIIYNKNVTGYPIKIFGVVLDDYLEMAEFALQQCEQIEEYVQVNADAEYNDLVLPDKLGVMEAGKICSMCNHSHHCGPTMAYGPETEIVTNDELAVTIDHYQQARQVKQQANRDWEEIKSKFQLPDGLDEKQWHVVDVSGKTAYIVQQKRGASGRVTTKIIGE